MAYLITVAPAAMESSVVILNMMLVEEDCKSIRIRISFEKLFQDMRAHHDLIFLPLEGRLIPNGITYEITWFMDSNTLPPVGDDVTLRMTQMKLVVEIAVTLLDGNEKAVRDPECIFNLV
jgi:hypothetical protein